MCVKCLQFQNYSRVFFPYVKDVRNRLTLPTANNRPSPCHLATLIRLRHMVLRKSDSIMILLTAWKMVHSTFSNNYQHANKNVGTMVGTVLDATQIALSTLSQ